MKKMILLAFVLLATFVGNVRVEGQELKNTIEKEAKKAEKEVKKLERKMKEEFLYREAEQALENQAFVLEADRVIFKRGRSTFVNSSTNFVALNESRATVQIAFNGPYSGPNGMGGVTVEGQVSNIQMNKDKKGNINFSMQVTGLGISAQVNILLYSGSNKASVTVSPSFNSNRITLNGELFPIEKSNIFKGRSL